MSQIAITNQKTIYLFKHLNNKTMKKIKVIDIKFSGIEPGTEVKLYETFNELENAGISIHNIALLADSTIRRIKLGLETNGFVNHNGIWVFVSNLMDKYEVL